MAITLVQQNTVTQTEGSTVTITLGSTPSSSSLLVVILDGIAATAGWTAPNIGANAWTFQSLWNSNNDLVAAWVPSDGSTTSFTFTETNQAGNAWNQLGWIAEVSGMVLSSTLDKTNNGALAANATSIATSAATTTVANELWIAAAAPGVSGSATFSGGGATGGFSVIPAGILSHTSGGGPNSQGLLVATQIVSTTGTPSSTLSWTTAAGLGGSWGVITLKGLASVVPPQPEITRHGTPEGRPARARQGRRAPSAPPLARPGPSRVTTNRSLVLPARALIAPTPRAPALPPPRPRVTVNRPLLFAARARLGTPIRPAFAPPPHARVTVNRAQMQPARAFVGHAVRIPVVAPAVPPFHAIVTRNRFTPPTRTAARTGGRPFPANRLVNLN